MQDIVAQVPARSLFVFTTDNPIRKALLYIVTNKLFEWFMLACILGNCITLAMSINRPGFSESARGEGLAVAEFVWLGIFTVEMLAKIVSFGFVLEEGTYLRNGEE